MPAAGPNRIRVTLTRRARAALRASRGARLRVLLSATMVDRSGNRATDLAAVTVRG